MNKFFLVISIAFMVTMSDSCMQHTKTDISTNENTHLLTQPNATRINSYNKTSRLQELMTNIVKVKRNEQEKCSNEYSLICINNVKKWLITQRGITCSTETMASLWNCYIEQISMLDMITKYFHPILVEPNGELVFNKKACANPTIETADSIEFENMFKKIKSDVSDYYQAQQDQQTLSSYTNNSAMGTYWYHLAHCLYARKMFMSKAYLKGWSPCTVNKKNIDQALALEKEMNEIK